ncbi:hypothetical protein BP6252_05315 [Coleophoma cylindrospora]|uniref:HAD-like protein n=1 Tax=Coleophoma cylindrospora TaxID=1849047 RepID=A0A3D8RT40_9HELO|nr:hypothetical protein BP6252_05315 [Coleophoma cylindrospora]
MRPISLPPLIILDFDGTITKSDTINILFKHALSYQSSPARSNPQDFTSAYKTILSAYTSSYTAHLSTQPPKPSRVSVPQERDFLRSLRGVERASFARVGSQHIFRGIERREWRGFGRAAVATGDVLIRKGVTQLWDLLARPDGAEDEPRRPKCCVLSVNFSRGFVRGVLEAAVLGHNPVPGREEAGEEDGGESLDGVEILANSIDAQTGMIYGPEADGEVIATSEDKVRVMRDVVRGWRGDLSKSRSEGEEAGSSGGKCFYVGDSTTDLECLLEADVGLVMADTEPGSNLIETLRRIGLGVEHVSTFHEEHLPGRKEDQKTVWWARDFQEILDSRIIS